VYGAKAYVLAVEVASCLHDMFGRACDSTLPSPFLEVYATLTRISARVAISVLRRQLYRLTATLALAPGRPRVLFAQVTLIRELLIIIHVALPWFVGHH